MKKMRRSLSTILQLTIDNFDAISPRYCNQTYIESNDPTMIESELRSYIGIHWRMESIKVENLSTCANDLIRLITKFKNKYDTKGVYLATCYPLYPRYESRPTTFRDLINFHRDA
ncbi:2098_t:CDS:2, partial [Entrophospora sp. SA101]